MNLPIANAHASLCGNSAAQGTGVVGSTGSLLMCASSAGVTRGCRSGVSYISHHAISQRKPSAPVMTNAQYHP